MDLQGEQDGLTRHHSPPDLTCVQTFLYPRLEITRRAMTALSQGQVDHFGTLRSMTADVHRGYGQRLPATKVTDADESSPDASGTQEQREKAETVMQQVATNESDQELLESLSRVRAVMRQITGQSRNAQRPALVAISDAVSTSSSTSGASSDDDRETDPVSHSLDRLCDAIESRQIDYWRPSAASDSPFAQAVSSLRTEVRAMKGKRDCQHLTN